jgi:hypothetical protein
MTKNKKTYAQEIKAGLAELGITATVKVFDPNDPPAPKSGLTGQELADYFSPKPKDGTGGKNGN